MYDPPHQADSYTGLHKIHIVSLSHYQWDDSHMLYKQERNCIGLP